jgi:hypothetical protein
MHSVDEFWLLYVRIESDQHTRKNVDEDDTNKDILHSSWDSL